MHEEMSQQACDQLEELIDTYGLNQVLYSLQIIAEDKAEHVRVNWQDHDLAKTWEHRANRLDKLVSNFDQNFPE